MLYDRLVERARVDDGLDAVRLDAIGRVPWLVDLLDRQREECAEYSDDPFDEELQKKLDARLVRTRSELHRRLEGCRDDAERRAAALTLLLAAEFIDEPWEYLDELALVVPQARGWAPAEVAAALARVVTADMYAFWFTGSLSMALTAAERLTPDGLRAVAPWLRHAFQRLVDDSRVGTRERRALQGRIRGLLAAVGGARLPEGVLPARDPWAAPLRERLDVSAPPAELVELVMHLAGLSQPRPTQRWRQRCQALLDAADAHDLVRGCLRGLTTGEPLCSRRHGPHGSWYGDVHYHYLVHPNHADLARGVVWAAALAGGEPTARASTVRLLVTLALRTGGARRDVALDLILAGAAINALGDIDDEPALEALWRLQAGIRHRGLRKQLDTALSAAAGRRGITPGQLVERSVPTHGLAADGSLTRPLGDHEAVVAIDDPVTVRLTCVAPDGRRLRSLPASLKEAHADEVGELRALLKQVRGALAGERARVEALMSAERVWPYEEWTRYYREHPVTGAITRGLIWEFEGPGGEWAAAVPVGDGLVTADGRPLPTPDAGARVRLWHPIRAGVPEIQAWRGFVGDNRIRQPFKQAYREIYLLTPAERETGVYSNRFAAHIVRYPRLYALFKGRGWQANFLGPYDGGYSGEARGSFAAGEWRACFYHENADEGAAYPPEYAATDQVRFERRDGRGWREAPLAEVPPVVFSEAMRDVDLFVGVTSIAADPEWIDRGEDRYGDYWRTVAFGELTASAHVRRDALERILPRTKIADRCSVDGRYLVVRGDLRTYKIHLGSGNVLMEPDDAYLCIVPSRRKAGGTVFLPFEDERLALILSKAFLLADDARITDETILHQITRGAR